MNKKEATAGLAAFALAVGGTTAAARHDSPTLERTGTGTVAASVDKSTPRDWSGRNQVFEGKSGEAQWNSKNKNRYTAASLNNPSGWSGKNQPYEGNNGYGKWVENNKNRNGTYTSAVARTDTPNNWSGRNQVNEGRNGYGQWVENNKNRNGTTAASLTQGKDTPKPSIKSVRIKSI